MLANTETGEVLAHCTPDEARHLTEQIRSTADALWSLLLEAHERKAWAALGYARWEDYVATEFDMSRRHSYRLLDQARVVREIETAVVDVTHGSHDDAFPEPPLLPPISEREARDIKPRLTEVTEGIKSRLAEEAVENATPETIADIVNDEIDKARAKKKDREELDALEEELQPEGFDPALDAQLQEERGKLRRLCRDLSSLPEPAELIEKQHDYLDRLRTTAEVADQAYAWLDEFLAAMEAHR